MQMYHIFIQVTIQVFAIHDYCQPNLALSKQSCCFLKFEYFLTCIFSKRNINYLALTLLDQAYFAHGTLAPVHFIPGNFWPQQTLAPATQAPANFGPGNFQQPKSSSVILLHLVSSGMLTYSFQGTQYQKDPIFQSLKTGWKPKCQLILHVS